MPMRCKRCRGAAVIEVRRHNAAFCRDCFFHYAGQQVTRAIAKHRMLAPTDRVLVAVSGGKDSLALWDLLLELGYRTDGLYLSLGIGAYSERSKRVCEEFAAARGATLHAHDLAAEHGYTIPEAAGKGGRSSCGVCGLSKRYVFNRAALDGSTGRVSPRRLGIIAEAPQPLTPGRHVAVAYYDRKYGSDQQTGFMDITMRRGNGSHMRVTDRSLPPLNEFPEAGASTGVFLGDYIGLAVGSDGQAHPAWADTRNPIFTQDPADVRRLVNAGQGSDIYTRSLPG